MTRAHPFQPIPLPRVTYSLPEMASRNTYLGAGAAAAAAYLGYSYLAGQKKDALDGAKGWESVKGTKFDVVIVGSGSGWFAPKLALIAVQNG